MIVVIGMSCPVRTPISRILNSSSVNSILSLFLISFFQLISLHPFRKYPFFFLRKKKRKKKKTALFGKSTVCTCKLVKFQIFLETLVQDLSWDMMSKGGPFEQISLWSQIVAGQNVPLFVSCCRFFVSLRFFVLSPPPPIFLISRFLVSLCYLVPSSPRPGAGACVCRFRLVTPLVVSSFPFAHLTAQAWEREKV